MKPLSEDELREEIAHIQGHCFCKDNDNTCWYIRTYNRLDSEESDGDVVYQRLDSMQNDTIVDLILQDRKAWGEQEHRAGYVRGVNDFSGWYMDASIPAQRILIMPDIAKDLIDNYTPPVYKKQMFVS